VEAVCAVRDDECFAVPLVQGVNPMSRRPAAQAVLALVLSAAACGSSSSPPPGNTATNQGDGGTEGLVDAGGGPPADGASSQGTSNDAAPDASSCALPAMGMTGPHGLTQLYAEPGPVTVGTSLFSGFLAGGYVYFNDGGDLERVPAAGGATNDFGDLRAGPFVVAGSDLVYSTGVSYIELSSIVSAPLGTDAAAGKAIAAGLDTKPPGTMTTDGQTVFWGVADYGAGLYSVPADGSKAYQTLSTTAQVVGLTILGNNVYWTDLTNLLETMPLAGGTPTTIATLDDSGEATSDADAVYYIDFEDGTVSRVAAGSTTVQVLFTAPSGVALVHLAVNGDSVFISTNDSVWRVGTDGAGAEELACGFASPTFVAADAAYVYVGAAQGVYRLTR
jgi:hypothetical protein